MVNLTNRNQDHSPSSEPSTPTSPSPGHPNTPEKVDPDLKAYLMMMVKSFLMSSTIIMRYAFKSGTIFSGVVGCPGLGGVGVLVFVSKILTFAFHHLVLSGVSCYSCLWLAIVPLVILLASISRPGRLALSSDH